MTIALASDWIRPLIRPSVAGGAVAWLGVVMAYGLRPAWRVPLRRWGRTAVVLSAAWYVGLGLALYFAASLRYVSVLTTSEVWFFEACDWLGVCMGGFVAGIGAWTTLVMTDPIRASSDRPLRVSIHRPLPSTEDGVRDG